VESETENPTHKLPIDLLDSKSSEDSDDIEDDEQEGSNKDDEESDYDSINEAATSPENTDTLNDERSVATTELSEEESLMSYDGVSTVAYYESMLHKVTCKKHPWITTDDDDDGTLTIYDLWAHHEKYNPKEQPTEPSKKDAADE
jgi:hypothetical protein